jgi:elongation factor G
MSLKPPWPLMEVAVEPRSKADQEKLGLALSKMIVEDSSFTFVTDAESGQTILQGLGELHLDGKIDILKRVHAIQANVGAPQVAYRETITRKADIEYTHRKQTGATGEFARIKLLFEPAERGSGFVFKSSIVGGNVPKEFVPGVMNGLTSAKENGLIAGFPVIDFKATLYDGGYHDVDSSVLAFEIAARAAFRELREKGAPILLEPIMKVEVLTPHDYVDDIIGDLHARRGQVSSVERRDDERAITALAPLANLFGHVSNLRGISLARARTTLQFDHYAPVPLAPESGPDLFPPAAARRA